MTALDSLPAELPSDRRPSTTRGRARSRAFRGDARFFLGLILIVVSIAGVWAVVGLARQTRPVFVASHTLVPGQAVGRDDLAVVDVALGRVGDGYLTPDDGLSGVVAGRAIAAGELVPRAAVEPAARSAVTTVVVRSLADVPSTVRTGTAVEVWAAAQKERGVYGTPRILIPAATVASVARDDSMLGGGSAELELVIPRADVAEALTAITAGSAVSVIPTGGAG